MHMLSALLRLSHLLVFVASPQSPVALVEDVKGSPAGIQIMDYVETGKVIKLGPQDSIVLSYLTSCWRETINGGTVIVGKERSDVDGGMVERSTVACPGNKMLLRAEPTRTSGAEVFRNMPD